MKLKMLAVITVLLAIVFYLVPHAHAMPAQNLGNGITLAALPNLEAGIGIDLSQYHGTPTMLTSKLLTKDWLEMRVGGLVEGDKITPAGGFNINIRKITEAAGGEINYAWDGLLDISVGFWMGKDFSNSESRFRYGFGATFVILQSK